MKTSRLLYCFGLAWMREWMILTEQIFLVIFEVENNTYK